MSFFSVTWRIENFSMCAFKNGEKLVSPEFTLPELSNIKWKLSMYPKGHSTVPAGDYVSIFLDRTDEDQNTGELKFERSFAFINSNFEFSKEIITTTFIKYERNSSWGYYRFISHTELYKDAKGFLPNGILKFRLLIRLKTDDPDRPKLPSATSINEDTSNQSQLNFITENVFAKETENGSMSMTNCSFLTRIPVERRILQWSIENLSAKRESKEKTSVMLESKFPDGVKLLLFCYVKGSGEDGSLWIDILRKGVIMRRAFIKFLVSFTDSSNLEREIKKTEHLFDETYTRWSFKLIDKLDSSIDLINDDSLKMKCDFFISYLPQDVDYDKNTKRKLFSYDHPKTKLYQNHPQIQEMLEHEDTFDVIFQSKCKEKFPVHKFLVCSKSPVFRAMFSGDDKEKETGVVEMDDTDSTTVRHLKDYMYMNSFPDDSKTDEILKLYSVAVKYQMDELKNKCSDFLKNDMSVANVCEILYAADKNQDSGLKDYIHDFLNSDMDLDSDVWMTFMKENLPLAAETMRLCLKKIRSKN